MVGYKNERYLQFGCAAAHIDDMANYIPARLTAFLMVLCACLLYTSPILVKLSCSLIRRFFSPPFVVIDLGV